MKTRILSILAITLALAACSTSNEGLTPEQIAARERRVDAWSNAALGIGTAAANAYLAHPRGYAK